jgi:serine/threonine protein kinase
MSLSASSTLLTGVSRAAISRALPGLRLGPVLGHGAGGWVLAAHDEHSGRRLAVKIIVDDQAGDQVGDQADEQVDRQFSALRRDRIRTEAEILTTCRHPNLLRCFAFCELDELSLLVLERFDGPTVLDQDRSGVLGSRETCEIAIAAARALQCVHDFGFVHGDVKPDNVLYDHRGRHRLIDLGLARRWPSVRRRHIAGTPEYLAPEAIADRGVVGPATDVYALGVMTYELLAGVLPFLSADDPESTLRMHLRATPVPLRAVAPTLPPRLADLVMTALARGVDDRISSAAEFAGRLTEIIENDLESPSTSAEAETTPGPGSGGGRR